MRIMKILMSSLLLFFTVQASASDAFAEASGAACIKMKACALEEIRNDSSMPPETKAMMTKMLDGMCAQMQSAFNNGLTDHKLYEPAVACMNSMAKLSCAQIKNGAETAECGEFGKVSQPN